MTAPRIAIVQELLTVRGGAERVARRLTQLYPDAPVYTLLYDERALGEWFPPHRVRTSNLQRYARFSRNHHFYLRHFPAAVEAWDFSEFDVVLSSSSAFAHGIITNGRPRHISYVHSPARYLWDRTHDVLDRAGTGIVGPLRRWYLHRTFHRLRVWDSESAQRADRILTPSREVQRRVQLYWRRESDVLHPPIDARWLQLQPSAQERHGMLIVSTLAAYKRIELAILACESLGVPLTIVGEGPHRSALERIAGPHTTFVGYMDSSGLAELYSRAAATIFPGHEDFGLVPLESLACGTPVIAFGQGGALESLTTDTAVFFHDATPDALALAIRSMLAAPKNSTACVARARQFDPGTFDARVRQMVDEEMASLEQH